MQRLPPFHDTVFVANSDKMGENKYEAGEDRHKLNDGPLVHVPRDKFNSSNPQRTRIYLIDGIEHSGAIRSKLKEKIDRYWKRFFMDSGQWMLLDMARMARIWK